MTMLCFCAFAGLLLMVSRPLPAPVPVKITTRRRG
jgi:hypothetical protein